MKNDTVDISVRLINANVLKLKFHKFRLYSGKKVIKAIEEAREYETNGKKVVDPKCRDCVHYNNSEDKYKISLGYPCECPEKKWNNISAQYRYPSNKACKTYYKPRTDI